MAIKKTVHITDATIKTMSALPTAAAPIANFSSAVNGMSECFAMTMQACQPKMTESQRMALVCIYNGYVPSESLQQELRLLPWHISEGYQYDSQVTEFLGNEEDSVAFIETVKSWSDAQKLAAIYFARQYWTDNSPKNYEVEQ